ncbi:MULTISPECIES: DUF11 domain-containing protein [Streptomyces]|uniref:DUF7933 domain-containing protein n=1 Tax=Streptomyces TaxID=1883 RepID=UPI00131BF704|nr:DUF11 domain-containing protein [Streptomyces virginiae]
MAVSAAAAVAVLGLALPAHAAAQLSVSKSHQPQTFIRGSQATYTLNVSNTGDQATGPVIVTDPLPTGLTLVEVEGGPAWDCHPEGNAAICERSAGSEPGQVLPEITVTVNVAVDAPCTGVTNQVTVRAEVEGGFDPVIASDIAPVTGANCPPPGTPALAVSKSASPTTFTQGQSGQYTITVSNTGTASASNVVVQDTLPAGLTATQIDGGPMWECTLADLRCVAAGPVPAGTSLTPIAISVNVLQNAPCTGVTNSVSVSADGVAPVGDSVTTPVTGSACNGGDGNGALINIGLAGIFDVYDNISINNNLGNGNVNNTSQVRGD